MKYAITVAPLGEDDGGGWIAFVPDLPGCVGDGDTPEAAFDDARAAITEWVSEARRLGRAIPAPTVFTSTDMLPAPHKAA